MEIHDSEALFTPSEAHWIQVMGQYHPSMADLAKRVYAARIMHAVNRLGARMQVSPNNLALPEPGDETVRTAYDQVMDVVNRAELQFAMDSSGREQPVIKLVMDDAEKRALLVRAQTNPTLTAENSGRTEYYLDGYNTPDEEWEHINIMSEDIGFESAFAAVDLGHNPEFVAEAYEHDRVADLGDIDEQAVMRGIVTALTAELGTTEQ
ncbi:MAG TPA: hypothetical protein VLG11_05240 [Candidatus Saccharimonadales bacterium]|nr:hypothetical protein [Candidatus Saccharimonadales bacterium]